jgi:hydroxyacylglutathione hydrolase
MTLPSRIVSVCNNDYSQNSYLLVEGSNVVIVDPGFNGAEIKQQINELSLTALAVLLTHAHFDHIFDAKDVASHFNVDIYLAAAEKRILRHAKAMNYYFGHKQDIDIPEKFTLIEDGIESLSFGEMSVGLIHAPGHSPGSVCFMLSGALITGDVLMPGQIGRWNVPGGSKSEMLNSLNILAELDDEIIVLGGHGQATSIRAERELILTTISHLSNS